MADRAELVLAVREGLGLAEGTRVRVPGAGRSCVGSPCRAVVVAVAVKELEVEDVASRDCDALEVGEASDLVTEREGLRLQVQLPLRLGDRLLD